MCVLASVSINTPVCSRSNSLELKTFSKDSRIEKYLLRKSFDDGKLLPHCVLWRRKDGFSDGVSSHDRTTSVIIKEYIDDQVTDIEYEENKEKYLFNTPETKEEYHYRKMFELYYPGRSNLIPKYWKPNPKFHGIINEPSGRILESF